MALNAAHDRYSADPKKSQTIDIFLMQRISTIYDLRAFRRLRFTILPGHYYSISVTTNLKSYF